MQFEYSRAVDDRVAISRHRDKFVRFALEVERNFLIEIRNKLNNGRIDYTYPKIERNFTSLV